MLRALLHIIRKTRFRFNPSISHLFYLFLFSIFAVSFLTNENFKKDNEYNLIDKLFWCYSLIVIAVYFALGCSNPGLVNQDNMEDLIRPCEMRLNRKLKKMDKLTRKPLKNKSLDSFSLNRNSSNSSKLMNTLESKKMEDTINQFTEEKFNLERKYELSCTSMDKEKYNYEDTEAFGDKNNDKINESQFQDNSSTDSDNEQRIEGDDNFIKDNLDTDNNDSNNDSDVLGMDKPGKEKVKKKIEYFKSGNMSEDGEREDEEEEKEEGITPSLDPFGAFDVDTEADFEKNFPTPKKFETNKFSLKKKPFYHDNNTTGPSLGEKTETKEFLSKIYFIDEVEKKQYMSQLKDLITLDQHYCSKCNVDQPVRTKHCKVCKGCVATFDHHCIWLGNCIGEKNRPLFLLYLTLQIIDLIFAIVYVLVLLDYSSFTDFQSFLADYWFVLLALLMNIVFLVNVVILLNYHMSFMRENVTTWEYMMDDDLSYLEAFDLDKGSPFDLGRKQNTRLYLFPPVKEFYLWEGKKEYLKSSSA